MGRFREEYNRRLAEKGLSTSSESNPEQSISGFAIVKLCVALIAIGFGIYVLVTL